MNTLLFVSASAVMAGTLYFWIALAGGNDVREPFVKPKVGPGLVWLGWCLAATALMASLLRSGFKREGSSAFKLYGAVALLGFVVTIVFAIWA